MSEISDEYFPDEDVDLDEFVEKNEGSKRDGDPELIKRAKFLVMSCLFSSDPEKSFAMLTKIDAMTDDQLESLILMLEQQEKSRIAQKTTKVLVESLAKRYGERFDSTPQFVNDISMDQDLIEDVHDVIYPLLKYVPKIGSVAIRLGSHLADESNRKSQMDINTRKQ